MMLSFSVCRQQAILGVFASILLTTSHAFVDKNQRSPNNFYVELSGGYGVFKGVFSNDGKFAIQRLALGAQYFSLKNCALGAELGVQNGNYMRVNSPGIAFGDLPVVIFLKPPIDALIAVKCVSQSPLFIQAKAGVAYLQDTLDRIAFPNTLQLKPEMQLGLGFNITPKSNIIAYYQQIFAEGKPSFTNLNTTDGSANFKGLTTLRAGFLGVQIIL